MANGSSRLERAGFLGFTRYQLFVLFAAWLGWGFDVFDGLLFNYISPLCVPSLLGIAPNSPAAKPAIAFWTGTLTSLLLIGWATGGVLFGKITDRLGRSRTLLLTMATYALATAACAFAPNLYVLAALRLVASLGIGGEWAAGASLVAETVPPQKRVLAGALLYTSAPAGLFLATFVNDLFTRQLDAFASDPNLSWRGVFLTGLVPAAVALIIRLKVKEPETWAPEHEPRIADLFSPELRRKTIGGLAMALTALITWWSCNAFIPMIARFLADDVRPLPAPAALGALKARFVTVATTWFNVGGLLGTLLTVPFAERLGRRPMFLVYFCASALSIVYVFVFPMAPEARLQATFLLGLTVFGVFGSFTYYLPELFPMRLRGTGAGFCYNSGRYVTAIFPFLLGVIARSGTNPMMIIRWVAVVPVIGALVVLLGVVHETRDAA